MQTVVDFLCASGSAFQVDFCVGHERIGVVCHATLTTASTGAGGKAMPAGRAKGSGASMHAYALRYGVVHLLVAGSACARPLEELLLDVVGFWPSAYLAGVFICVCVSVCLLVCMCVCITTW